VEVSVMALIGEEKFTGLMITLIGEREITELISVIMTD
jgi:hypothetical protein